MGACTSKPQADRPASRALTTSASSLWTERFAAPAAAAAAVDGGGGDVGAEAEAEADAEAGGGGGEPPAPWAVFSLLNQALLFALAGLKQTSVACDASALPVSELAAEADVVLSLLSLARRLDAAARFPALERARPGLTQPHAAAALAAAMDDEPAAAQALAAAVGGRLLLGLAGASVSADPLSTAVDAVSALCAHATARLAAAEAAFAPARRGGVGGVTAGDAAAAVRAAEAADPANFPTLLVEAVLARVGDAGRAAFLAGLAAAGLPPGAAAACAATADALLSEPELLLVPTSPDGAGQFEGPLGALRGSGGGAAGAA